MQFDDGLQGINIWVPCFNRTGYVSLYKVMSSTTQVIWTKD